MKASFEELELYKQNIQKTAESKIAKVKKECTEQLNEKDENTQELQAKI